MTTKAIVPKAITTGLAVTEPVLNVGQTVGNPANGITDGGVPGNEANTTIWTVIQIPVLQIGPNPFQPRLTFEAEEMSDLIASVKAHGVLQPVTVRTVAVSTSAENGQSHKVHNHQQNAPGYHLIAGERRLRACRAAGRKTIPAIVRNDLSDRQAAELALVENVQRANLSVIEEARAYKRLMVEFRLKEERIAKKVGKSVQVVRDTLKLLALPEAVQQMLAVRKLSASHGHLLLKLAPFQEICTLVATHVEGSGLTATALGQNLLPNARQLSNKKLVAELDYRTKFDWRSVCGNCPHKAYFTAGYVSYCAKPEEWQRKQTEAIELQKLEAARVLEEAKAKEGAVDVSVLPSGSYRDLTFAQIPAGCSEECACRSSSCLQHDPTRKRAICLDPARYDELVKTERAAIVEARHRRYLGFYQEAKTLIVGESIDGTYEDSATTIVTPPESNGFAIGRLEVRGLTDMRLSLLALTIISGEHTSYLNRERWDGLCREVAQDLALALPWEQWQDEEATVAAMLGDLQKFEASALITFCACLLLGYEAMQALGFGGQTPLLAAVLGHGEAVQGELMEDEENESDSEMDNDEMPEDELDENPIKEAQMSDELEENELEDHEVEEEFSKEDFEGSEFEDEQFHVAALDVALLEPRSYSDEPYQNGVCGTKEGK